jgi:uncharacterized protein (DUF885 family)
VNLCHPGDKFNVMDRRDFVRLSATFATGAAAVPLLHACKLESRPEMADEGFVRLRNNHFRNQLVLNPVTSTYLGGDGWDATLRDLNGRYRDYTPGALADEARDYRELERQLPTVDAQLLSQQGRVDYAVLTAQLAFLRNQIERRHHERALDTYVGEPFRGIDLLIQQMVAHPDGTVGDELDWRLIVTRLSAIPSYLTVARANLETGRRSGNAPDRRMVQRDGIVGSRANATYFRTTLPRMAKDYLGTRSFAGTMLSGLAGAGDTAARAFEAFATWLERTFPPTDSADRFALGEPQYEWRVQTLLRVNRSAAELFEYGAQQVDEYTRRIADVAERISRERGIALPFGSPEDRSWSIRRVMDDLSNESPSNDDELFRWYRETADRAVAYGRERGMFDIPAEYKLEIAPTPPVLRSAIDAVYYPAPPLKKTGVGRFYLTPTGNDPAALRQHARASVADTAVHEGFPGHDWHFKYMTQHASEISNIRWLTPGAVEDSSSMWADSMAAEGWGLYAEELMAEPSPERPFGFYSAPEYLYELQGQLLRAVRVRVDVGLHTGRMSFDEALDYYTEKVDFFAGAREKAAGDPNARAVTDGATRAIYRYSKWPTQAITYNLGKTAIIELRETFRSRRGQQYTPRTFHERFMRMGTVPPGFFRDALLAV